MTRARRLLGVGLLAGVVLAVGASVAYLRSDAFEQLVREQIARRAAALGLEVSYADLRVTLVPPGAALAGLTVRVPDGLTLAQVEQARVEIELRGLLHKEVRIVDVRLDQPRVQLHLDEAHRPVGLPPQLVAALGLTGEPDDATPPPPPDDAEGAPGVVLERLHVTGARITVADDNGYLADLVDLTFTFFRHAGVYSVVAKMRTGLVQTPDISQRLDVFKLEGALRLPEPETRGTDATGAPVTIPGVTGDLRITSLQIVTPDANMSLHGRVLFPSLEPARLREAVFEPTEIVADLPLGAVHRAFPEDAPQAEGHVALVALAQGSLAEPRVNAKLTLTDAVVDGYVIGNVRVEARADRKALHVSKLELMQPAIDVRLEATLDFDDDLTLHAKGRADRADFAQILDAVQGPDSMVTFDGVADFEVTGPLRPKTGEFHLDGKAVVGVSNFVLRYDGWHVAPATPNILDFPSATVATGLRVDPVGVHFIDAQIAGGDTQLHANATIGYPPDGTLHVSARSERFVFDDIGTFLGLEIGGHGRMRVEIHGPYQPWISIQGALDFEDTRFAGHPLGAVHAEIRKGDRPGNSGKLYFSKVTAEHASTTVAAEGEFDVDQAPVAFEWRASRIHGRIEEVMQMLGPLRPILVPEILQDATGDLVSANARIEGDVEKPYGAVEMWLRDANVPGFLQRLDAAHVVIDAPRAGGVVIEEAEVERGGGRVRFSGAIGADGRARFHGKSERLRLEAIDAFRTWGVDLRGEVGMTLSWSGTALKPDLTITTAVDEAQVGKTAVGDAVLVFHMDGDRWSSTGTLFGGALEIAGEATMRPEARPYELAVRMKSTALHQIVPADPNAPPRPWRAIADGTLLMHGDLLKPAESSGEAKLEHLSVIAAPDAPPFESDGPVTVRFDRGGFRVGQAAFRGQHARFEIRGGRTAGRDLDLRLEGRLDAHILPTLTNAVAAAEGTIDVDVAVGGTPSSPDFLGSASMRIDRLKVRQFTQPITEVRGAIVFGPGSAHVSELTGRVGEGSVRVEGDLALGDAASQHNAMRLAVRVSHVRTAIPTDLPAVVSGELTLVREPGARLPVLGGLLYVEDARYTRKLGLVDKVVETMRNRPIAPTVFDRDREIVRFDFGLRADRTLHVRNNRMDIDLSGDLRVTGTNQRVGLVGVVEAVRGRVDERDHTYTIRRGRIEFTDPQAVRIAFDVTVETELRGTVEDTARTSETSFFGAPRERAGESVCKLVITISGTPDGYESTFTSPDCAYTDEELKHWLATGSPREADALHALSNVGIDVLMDVSGIDRELRRLVPGARLRVSNVYRRNARTSNDTVTQVTLEWQPAERLRLSFSSALSQDEPDQRLFGEVRLNKVSSLEATAVNSGQSEVADFGLDLKLRWEY